MSLSSLPLCYCTNVHPGNTLDEVLAGLDKHAVAVARRRTAPTAVGLWLARSVMDDVLAPAGRRRLCEFLERRRMSCYTLNAFPFGDFHGKRVKENVYRPDWADPARVAYTLDCAAALADLLPPGGEGSLSSLPLSFKPFHSGEPPMDAFCEHVLGAARKLHRLWRDTGRRIRLAVEPEPFCVLETTAEAIAFFDRLFARADAAGLEPIVREYVGLCYDVCHQAVEFEDVAASIADIRKADIRINKVHITCAIELRDPAGNEAGRKALAGFVEERYLHQTFARTPDGRVLKAVDLTEELALRPGADWLSAKAWRVHFHVPVGAEHLGPLHTTRDVLRQALAAVAKLPYAPHLEVETYTWNVLPPEQRQALAPDLATGIAAELSATDAVLAGLRPA
jgi:sugar phosphate isomerase/epimerase